LLAAAAKVASKDPSFIAAVGIKPDMGAAEMANTPLKSDAIL